MPDEYGGSAFNPSGLSVTLDYAYKNSNQKIFTYWGEGKKWYNILGSPHYHQPESALTHELLGHGLDAQRALAKGQGIPNNQDVAVGRANKLRKIYGWPQRTQW